FRCVHQVLEVQQAGAGSGAWGPFFHGSSVQGNRRCAPCVMPNPLLLRARKKSGEKTDLRVLRYVDGGRRGVVLFAISASFGRSAKGRHWLGRLRKQPSNPAGVTRQVPGAAAFSTRAPVQRNGYANWGRRGGAPLLADHGNGPGR